MINLTSANFITSIVDTKEFAEGISEVVFMGRSNVGKSSLLNSLTNKKNLARKSQTPGKTQTINYFDIEYSNENKEKFKCLFVDLPGIGYAKVSKSIKEEWARYLNKFINNRTSVRIYIYLIDARHTSLDIDIETIKHLESILKPDQLLLKIYTKIDKLNQSQKSKLLDKDKNIFLISNTKKKGIDKVNQKIFDFLFNISSGEIKYFVKH
jgi:GTP-binding protein